MAPKKKKTEIQELSEFIRDRMVTKDDLAGLVTKGESHSRTCANPKKLDEHTRRLGVIGDDVKTSLDKRLTLQSPCHES